VVQARKTDFWGSAGELGIRVRFLLVGNTKVDIQGDVAATGRMYVIVRGSNGVVKTGTPVRAYVVSDTAVEPGASGTDPAAPRAIPPPCTDTRTRSAERTSP
jgi:hypothetical protein